MAVRKRGKTWVVDYRVHGKRYIRAVGPSKREALAVEGKIKGKIYEGRFGDKESLPVAVTFGELIQKYLEHFVGRRSIATETIHLNTIQSHFGSSRLLHEINRIDVEAFRAKRLGTPTMYGRPRSHASVNRELAVLHRLLARAVAWEWIEKNPASGVKKLPEEKGRMRFLSVEEAGRLLKACPSHLYPIVLCALETGMRRGEILSLRWEDVDLFRRMIYVGRTKTGVPRHVPVSTRLEETLSRLSSRDVSEYLFHWGAGSGRKGKPFKQVKTSFANACRKASIEGFRFHDLRHTAASHMVMAGVPLRVVGEILGHTTVSMTERYSHLLPEHKIRAVEMLPDWRGSSPGQLPGHQSA